MTTTGHIYTHMKTYDLILYYIIVAYVYNIITNFYHTILPPAPYTPISIFSQIKKFDAPSKYSLGPITLGLSSTSPPFFSYPPMRFPYYCVALVFHQLTCNLISNLEHVENCLGLDLRPSVLNSLPQTLLSPVCVLP